MAKIRFNKLEANRATTQSIANRVLTILALNLLITANANAATLTITGPAEVVEGDAFQVQIWGDFTSDGLIAGGITFSLDDSLVQLDSRTLNLSVRNGLSCPGSANCPLDTANSTTVVWGQFLTDLIPPGAGSTLMTTLDFTAIAPGTANFGMADIPALTGGWFGAGFADIGAPEFLDLSICIATVSGDNDDDGVLDCADPDDDNDGIADIYDRQPLVASNQCDEPNTGDDRTLSGATISGDRTCAAKESVVVDSATQVTTTGDLRVISKTVRFGELSVGENGMLEVINADPCPGCPVCGNGILEAPEQCDDGNLTDGDGCSAICLIE